MVIAEGGSRGGNGSNDDCGWPSDISIFRAILCYMSKQILWVSVSLTGKIFDGYIKYLGFSPRVHQKLIGVLVWW